MRQWCRIIIIMVRDDSKLLEKFSMKLKIERVKRKLSQEALAELSGLNRRTISTIETGDTVPSIITVERLAQALGIELYKLFIFED